MKKHEIKVRLTDDELQHINTIAKKANRSREHCIRQAMKDAKLYEVPPVEYFNLIRELRIASKCLNQLATVAYSKSFVDAPELKKQVMHLRETEQKIRNAFQVK